MLAPSTPAAVPYPINRRRVTLPRYQNSSVQSFALSVIVCSLPGRALMGRQVPCQRPVLAGAMRPAWLGQAISFSRIRQDMRPDNAAPVSQGPIGNEPAEMVRALADDIIGGRWVSFWLAVERKINVGFRYVSSGVGGSPDRSRCAPCRSGRRGQGPNR